MPFPFPELHNYNLLYPHPGSGHGPYATSGDQWVSYDDPAAVRRKAEWVVEGGWAGAMVWALDLDDFSRQCGCEQFPLLRTLNRVLRRYPVPEPQCDIYTAAEDGDTVPTLSISLGDIDV